MIGSMHPSRPGRLPQYSVLVGVLLLFGLLLGTLYADSVSIEYLRVHLKSAEASSTLREKGKPADFYSAGKTMDDDHNTAWCAASKSSAGEWVEVKFPPKAAAGVNVLNGYGRNLGLYLANNRVKDYEVSITERNGRTTTIKGAFTNEQFCLNSKVGGGDEYCQTLERVKPGTKQYTDCMNNQKKLPCLADPGSQPGHVIGLNGNRCLTSLKFRIVSVFKGEKYNDTCIATMHLTHPYIFDSDYEGRKQWEAFRRPCETSTSDKIPPDIRYVATKGGASLRAQADIKAAQIALIPIGSKVEIQDYGREEDRQTSEFGNVDIWVRIAYGGKQGWVFHGQLEMAPPGQKVNYPALGKKSVAQRLLGCWKAERDDTYMYFEGNQHSVMLQLPGPAGMYRYANLSFECDERRCLLLNRATKEEVALFRPGGDTYMSVYGARNKRIQDGTYTRCK